MSRRIVLFGSRVVLALFALATVVASSQGPATAAACREIAPPARMADYLQKSTRRFADFDALARDIAQREPLAVIIGEIHTDAIDQANEVALTKALATYLRIDGVALELVDDVNLKTVQSFFRGELSGAALALALNRDWGWGVDGYIPLFEWARANGVAVRRIHYRVSRRTFPIERRIHWDLAIYRRDEARDGHTLVYIVGEKRLSTLTRELPPDLRARVVMIQQYEGQGPPEFVRISNAALVCAARAAGFAAPDGLVRMTLAPTLPDGRTNPGDYGIFDLRPH